MDHQSLILQFWKHEAIATRKVIARIPSDKSDYRPHPVSRSALELAWLLVIEEKILIDGLESGIIDWHEDDVPTTMEEIVAIYDKHHDDIVTRMEHLDAKAWKREISFTVEGQEYRRGSGLEYGWEFLFDQIHHRGQLSTYLRPMGLTVPSIIGPSADEIS